MADEGMGGVEATVRLDTTNIDAGVAHASVSIDRLATKFRELERAGSAVDRPIRRGLDETAKAARMAGHRLQVFGQGLDDLQYVGEQGLRPIINNLMQISPALGIAAIGVRLLWDHTEKLGNVIENTTEYWEEFLGVADRTDTTVGAIDAIRDAWKDVTKWLKEAKEGWDALAGSKAIAEREVIKKFTAAKPGGDIKQGQAIAGVIKDFGHREFLDEALAVQGKLDAKVRAGDPEARRQFEAMIISLVEAAKKGDMGAIAGLQFRLKGTEVGARMATAAAGADAARVADEKARAASSDARAEAIQEIERRRREKAQEQSGFEAGGAANVRKFERERAERILKDTPGLETILERRFLGLLTGKAKGDPAKAQAALQTQIRQQLQKAGVEPGEALRRASGISEDIRRGVTEDIMEKRLNPEVRQSRVMAMADLNRSVQESITNANPQLRKLDEIKNEIAKILVKFDQGKAPFMVGN